VEGERRTVEESSRLVAVEEAAGVHCYRRVEGVVWKPEAVA
jgi:hypothetical protein